MKKSILNFGKALNKAEQKTISGGNPLISFNKCYRGSDPRCCGTAQGQCGVGPHSGGLFQGYYNGRVLCACF